MLPAPGSPLRAPCSPLSARLRVSALELSCYMRNQLLRDADWASMAHSLEVRVPFVDPGLLRSVVSLCAAGAAPGKKDMARATPRPLPTAIFDRPKTGFTVPVRDWLLGSDPRSPRSPLPAPCSLLPAPSSPERGLRGWAKFVYSRYTGMARATASSQEDALPAPSSQLLAH